MDLLFSKIEKPFYSHQSLPNLEVELRLGKKNGNMFDTNIGEQKFMAIKNAMDNFKGWEQVKQSSTSSYFSNGKRCDYNDETEESSTIVKKKVVKIDHVLNNEPLDIRFAISQEIPTDEFDDSAEYMRQKNRISYIRKNLSIDLTKVTGDCEDMDDESEDKYEVEMEIIDPKKVTSKKELYNIIYKIQCILKTL